jgi:methionine-rich copper-binding protein CopC
MVRLTRIPADDAGPLYFFKESMMNRLNTLAVGVLLSLSVVTQAFAHAHLQTAVPMPNGEASVAPDALRLKFSEGLELAFTGLTLKAPDATMVPLGQSTLAAGDDATLIVPVTQHLAAGKYVVTWHALSKDGHTTHGDYTFTVK